jgi:hypothetical protein
MGGFVKVLEAGPNANNPCRQAAPVTSTQTAITNMPRSSNSAPAYQRNQDTHLDRAVLL